ncbi:MAG: glycosyltransferase family 87 protein [Hyphomonadaceae bacterium]
MPLTRRAFEIAALAVAFAVLGVMGWRLLEAHGLLLADGQPVFGDFIAFWSAGRAVLEGHAAQVHDAALIADYHQQAVPGVAYVAPWNSPPPFLLIATPLALLPFPLAALTWLALSGALYVVAARKLLPDARALLFALTLPAALYHLGSVQTGLWIAGVTGLALYWLDTRPRLAGSLVALLAIKPHMAVLWPLFLALTGRWRAFLAAAIATLAFLALAGFAFGFDSYTRFFATITATQDLVTSQRITTPAYATLYASLLGFGAPQSVAMGAQALSAIAAIGVAGWIWMRKPPPAIGGAVLCAATLAALPYAFFYDFTLLAVGAALLGAPRDRLELAALVLAWSAGLSIALGYLAPLPLCPAAAWMVLIVALRRAGNAAARRAPAPPP